MARESTAFAGSGISALREGLTHNSRGPVRALGGTNSIVVNYEDINSSIGTIQSSGLLVTADAVHVSGPANRLRGRRELRIQNMGEGLAYVGDSTVTTANGLCIPSGTTLALNVLDVGDIYAVSASTSDLRIFELK